jgi:hypothetical protein
MITVLLASASIAPGRLEVAVGRRTNPDVGVGRRDGKTIETKDASLVANLFPPGVEVGEFLAAAAAGISRAFVADVTQAGFLRDSSGSVTISSVVIFFFSRRSLLGLIDTLAIRAARTLRLLQLCPSSFSRPKD